jgi:hypothetical protein
LKPRRWRMSMTVAVIVSFLIGLAAAGLGLWDLHKINKTNGQISSIDSSVPAMSMITPSTGQTLSGIVGLDAGSLGGHITGAQFLATGGSSHNVSIANAVASIDGWAARWNSASLPNGTYQISSVGYNASGRSSRSPAVTVSIQNP